MVQRPVNVLHSCLGRVKFARPATTALEGKNGLREDFKGAVETPPVLQRVSWTRGRCYYFTLAGGPRKEIYFRKQKLEGGGTVRRKRRAAGLTFPWRTVEHDIAGTQTPATVFGTSMELLVLRRNFLPFGPINFIRFANLLNRLYSLYHETSFA